MKKVILFATTVLTMLAGHAQTVNNIKPWEFQGELIAVPAPQSRVKNITWVQLPDDQVHEECFNRTKGKWGTKRIVSCATYKGDVCTIITGINTTTANLGHEMRHCYDKNYHD